MTIRITNLRCPVESDERDLPQIAAGELGISTDEVQQCRILRKSLDARSRNRLEFVYSVGLDLQDSSGEGSLAQRAANADVFVAKTFEDPECGPERLDDPPVIIGSGPAGLLAGYMLALKGYRPVVIERGEAVKERVPAIRSFDRGGDFELENNYLFGEGGAGCFSDGKLTCRISGPDVDWVLERFVECGGKSEIIYEQRPHLGSNRLPMICRNFRRRIEAMGGRYEFGCRMEGLDVVDGTVRGVMTSSGYVRSSAVVLGIGHSARDTYQMLYDMGVPFQQKAFQLGVRIEQPQETVNRHKYGRDEYLQLLGAADYSLVAKGQNDLFSFCMCAGGIIIPSVSEPNMFCSNGMSNSRHDSPFANSGLVVTLEPSEFGSSHPLAGVEVQRKYESLAFQLGGGNYLSPIQRASDFVDEKRPTIGQTLPCSYERGTVAMSMDEILPPVISQAIRKGLPVMDHKWRGDYLKDAILVGPEMRGSSPVRIERDRQSWECPGFSGLFPVGEGAGYAGGIVTAAVDGLRAAKKIVERFQPLDDSTVSDVSEVQS